MKFFRINVRLLILFSLTVLQVQFVFAQTNDCFDTIQRNRIFLSTDTSLSAQIALPQKNGNVILLSKIWKEGSSFFLPVISKIDMYGNILWSKKIINPNTDSSILLLNAIEMTDGSIVAYGVCSYTSDLVIFKHIILRLSTSGNIISYKAFIPAALPYSITGFSLGGLCELDNNGIGLLINLSPETISNLMIVSRLDLNNAISWSRFFYSIQDVYYPSGITNINDGIIIPGSFHNDLGICNNIEKTGSHIMKLNLNDGSLMNYKSYCQIPPSSGSSISFGFKSNFFTLTRLTTGNLKLTSVYNGSRKNGRVVIAIYDTLLNLKTSKLITDNNTNDYWGSLNYTVNSSGNLAFTYLGLNSEDVGYIVVDSSYDILQQKKVNFPSGITFPELPWINKPVLNDDNDLTIYYTTRRNNKSETETIKTNIYRTDTSCIGKDTVIAHIEDLPMVASNWNLTEGNNNVLIETPFSITVSDITFQKQLDCEKILGPPVLNAGNDLVKCNNDTVVIHATAGYNNYSWTPEYNISNYVDSVTSVFPGMDTSYIVNAEVFPGCIVNDTVLVSVKTSLPIILGNDTSFCKGASVILNAGSDFTTYQWSNGVSSQTVLIDQPGIYSVKATDVNTCSSIDTLQVLPFLPQPVVSIHNQTTLCKGQNDTLHAGNSFSSYYWQDGSTENYFHVVQQGMYEVQVTNQYNCTNRDSVIIDKLRDEPSHFIFTDTAICQHNDIMLKPNQTFSQYNWSTGSNLSSINIKEAGIYVLRVMDQYGCKGEETINVKEKDCINKLFFPSAFTPNQDGKNDFFKPSLIGAIEEYELTIYNRWGQIIFKTKSISDGWNGSFNSHQQNNDVFVWVCRYKFYDQPSEIEKGILTLIR